MKFSPTFDDARLPTESERKSLARLIYMAFCDVRALTKGGHSEQARDLADAFHNVPLLMHTASFSFSAMRRSLDSYRSKYPDGLSTDYLAEWEKLQT
jgi:hypothetical protein